MPELPEVETVKEGLRPHCEGAFFHTVRVNRPNLRYPFPNNFVETLTNRRCNKLRRRGKYILMDFDGDITLVVHLGMSGSFTINPTTKSKHDHVEWTTNDGTYIVYNDPRRFGMMFFITTGQENTHKAFASMGVEPLSNHCHADYLFEQLRSKKTSIKACLLNQNIIAGIGNIYACEALFTTGISPQKMGCDLSLDDCARLVPAIQSVLRDAIQSGGSTLRDHRQTDGTMGYFQHHFNVYDKQGHPCPTCGTLIERIVQNNRSTFFCPNCQK